jgi:hypothetical protein
MNDLIIDIIVWTGLFWFVLFLIWFVYSALTATKTTGNQGNGHGHLQTGPQVNIDGTPMVPGSQIDISGKTYGSTDHFGQ